MSELIFSFPLTSLRLRRNKILQQIHTAKGKDSAAINSEILKLTGNCIKKKSYSAKKTKNKKVLIE